MKSILLSIQPYYVFLIIAQKMSWDIPQHKDIEVRKNRPKDNDWDKVTKIYCSTNIKSFNRIPKQYQPYMQKLLGKVIGEFVCDDIVPLVWGCDGTVYCPLIDDITLEKMTRLNLFEIEEYLKKKDGYGWHISDLKIYDKPKELNEFKKAGYMTEEEWLYALYPNTHCHYGAWAKKFEIKTPPQSWCYIHSENTQSLIQL